jgi:hypothetical protein
MSERTQTPFSPIAKDGLCPLRLAAYSAVVREDPPGSRILSHSSAFCRAVKLLFGVAYSRAYSDLACFRIGISLSPFFP